MLSNWSRAGELLASHHNRGFEGTVYYKNTNRGSVLVREIHVEYSATEDLTKFTFFPENYKETALLRNACIASFTNEERKKFVMPENIHNQSSLAYLKIKINTAEIGKKLIAFCHHININSDKTEFSKNLIIDFKNIISGVVSSLSNYQEKENKIYYSTPAYINPFYDTNTNFTAILPNPFTNRDFNKVFQLFRNGFNPNHRDLNGMTLLCRLVQNYIKNKSFVIFRLIELALIYGAYLFELDNGKYMYISASTLARNAGAFEILNLVLLNIKAERPLKVLSYEHKLKTKEKIITSIAFDNKKMYQVELMTINQFNKNKLARSDVFELFKIMYKNSDKDIIKEEFDDSFSDDNDEELTMVLLVLSYNKIVGFTVYNIAPTITIDHAFLLPEEKLGGMMAFIILSLGFSLYASIKEPINALTCWAAHSNGSGVFTTPGNPFYWPKYNIKDIDSIIKKLTQSEEPLQLTTRGIGIQRVESLTIAGQHKISGLEQRLFYNYIMGFDINQNTNISLIENIDISALLIFPLTFEFFRNVIKNAEEKLNFKFLPYVIGLGLLLPGLTSKISSSKEDNLYKLLTLPKSPTLFAVALPIENNQQKTTFNFIKSKL